jgi:hypothetical protein
MLTVFVKEKELKVINSTSIKRYYNRREMVSNYNVMYVQFLLNQWTSEQTSSYRKHQTVESQMYETDRKCEASGNTAVICQINTCAHTF